MCFQSGLGSYGHDIDECQTLSNLCENGQCINTFGSYRCICNRGFKPDQSGTRCLDVDECKATPRPCEFKCDNSFGSFVCSCSDGYTLSANGRSCRDIDECEIGAYSCESDCVNTEGSFHCACPPGFTELGDLCIDTDECVDQPVSQIIYLLF